MPKEGEPFDIRTEIEKLKLDPHPDFDPFALTVVDPAEEGWSKMDMLRAFAKARRIRRRGSGNSAPNERYTINNKRN